MSDNVNNKGFYRKIAFFLDRPKNTARHDELLREIKKRRCEIDAMEKELFAMNCNLEDIISASPRTIQLVNTALLSLTEASQIQKEISNDDSVYTIESNFGIVNLYYQRIAAPEGTYYAFGSLWNITTQFIYECGEDAMQFHVSTAKEKRGHCKGCCYYNCGMLPHIRVKKYRLHAPGLSKYGSGTWKRDCKYILLCQKCRDGGGFIIRELNKDIDYIQKEYHKSMCYPESLILLLCARSLDKTNILYKDNFPLDMFKTLFRFIFPETFLTIK